MGVFSSPGHWWKPKSPGWSHSCGRHTCSDPLPTHTRLCVGHVHPPAFRCACVRWPAVERYTCLPESEPTVTHIFTFPLCFRSSLFCPEFLAVWCYVTGWAISFATGLAHPPLRWGSLVPSLIILSTWHTFFLFVFLPAVYCWKLVWSEPVNHEASNKKVMKPRVSNLTALVAFLHERRCGSWNEIASNSLCWRGVGSAYSRYQIKYTWKSEVQRPTALQHILANYVVSKLLGMEDGGMAIFYLHSETEAVFDPLPLFKNLIAIFRKHTYYTTHLGAGGDRTKPTKTTPTRIPRKPAANLVTNPPLSCIPAQ